MQNSEKLCLKWNDFQENLNSAFGSLRNDKELVDVTLACEDGSIIAAHKVILATSSPFFMEILAKNKHPHPLIFMRGVKAREMMAIVDFVYCGEASVDQENLETFLLLAEEMKLKGLTSAAQGSEKKTECLPQKTTKKYENMAPDIIQSDMNSYHLENKIVLDTEEVQQMDEQIKSLMEASETILTVGKSKVRAKICKVCGKEGQTANIMTHIESNHLNTSSISHSCNICGKISRSKTGLRMHTTRYHPEIIQIQTHLNTTK